MPHPDLPGPAGLPAVLSPLNVANEPPPVTPTPTPGSKPPTPLPTPTPVASPQAPPPTPSVGSEEPEAKRRKGAKGGKKIEVDPKEYRRAEQCCEKTLSTYRQVLSAAESIKTAVASDKDWEWLRLPNKLMRELHKLLAIVEEKTTSFFTRILASDDVRNAGKTKTHYEDMVAASAALDKPLELLADHNKRLTGMHSTLMSMR